MKPTLTYVIADDHSLIREGIISKIQADAPHVKLVAEAVNGKELLHAIATLEQAPDIAILDLSMPVMDGAETARKIIELHPTTKIVVLSLYTDENTVINLFNIGVHGFIGKTGEKLNFSPVFDELMQNGFLDNKYYRLRKIDELDWKKFAFIGRVKLTHKEMQFLKLKLTNLTLVEIAETMFVSPKTAENYRASVYEKLGVSSRVELTTKLVNMGFYKNDPTNL